MTPQPAFCFSQKPPRPATKARIRPPRRRAASRCHRAGGSHSAGWRSRGPCAPVAAVVLGPAPPVSTSGDNLGIGSWTVRSHTCPPAKTGLSQVHRLRETRYSGGTRPSVSPAQRGGLRQQVRPQVPRRATGVARGPSEPPADSRFTAEAGKVRLKRPRFLDDIFRDA